MKKRMFHKGMAAVLAVSLTTGGALPFMAQTVHAEDTAAEQGQTPEKKSGTVTLEKKNDGTYVFGNEYLKRTFSLSADKVLSTKEITNYRTGTPTVFTPQAGSEEYGELSGADRYERQPEPFPLRAVRSRRRV